VLAFSGVILLLAIAIPLLAQLAGGRSCVRVSLVAAAGAGLSSIANIFEDGLRMSWVFVITAPGSAIQLFGLLLLAIVTALRARGGRRLLALFPAGTATGILLYVVAGGLIMLVTWLIAAVLALAMPTRPSSPAVSTNP